MRNNHPAIEERQTRAFDLSVAGFSFTQISALLKVNRRTVALDVRAEGARRGAEHAADRAELVQRSVAAYERVTSESSLRVQALTAAANAEPNGFIAANLRGLIPREVAVQLRARQQSAETQGLLAPIEVIDVGLVREVEVLRAKLLGAENNLRARTIADQREAFISGERTELPDGYA